MATHIDVDGPDATSQIPSEAPQPQCAAAAMMHGMSMTPASSLHGGCPTIAEHLEFTQSMQTPMESSMEPYRVLPKPGYKCQRTILTFHGVLVNPAILLPFYVIATLWTVQTIHRVPREAQVNLQMTLAISIATYPLRTSGTCRSIARSSISKQHAVVYGQKAFRPRSWMSERRSSSGSPASSIQSITTIIVKLSFNGASEASSYHPESFNGLRSSECSIPLNEWRRSMG